MLTWFPFTPLSKPWVSSSRRKLQLLTHTGGRNLARCSHHCLHCLWAHQQECDLKEAAPLNSCRPSYLLSLCLGCSCHKSSFPAGLLLVLCVPCWIAADTVTAGGPAWTVSSCSSLSRECRMLPGYLHSSINLQAISRISISVFLYDVNARFQARNEVLRKKRNLLSDDFKKLKIWKECS